MGARQSLSDLQTKTHRPTPRLAPVRLKYVGSTTTRDSGGLSNSRSSRSWDDLSTLSMCHLGICHM